MAESNQSWVWLEQAAQEARDTIERLYGEGRSTIHAERVDETAPAQADQVSERPGSDTGGPGDTTGPTADQPEPSLAPGDMDAAHAPHEPADPVS